MISLAAKTALYRRSRLVMTMLSIALGVGFMTATLAMGDSIKKGTDATFASTAASSDLVVRSVAAFGDSDLPDAREPMPTSALDAVAGIDGVADAAGVVSGGGAVGAPDGGWSSTAVISSADGIGSLSPFRLASGRGPERRDEVLIDAATARDQDIEIGDQVTIQSAQTLRAIVTGTAAMGDVEGVAGLSVVLPTLSSAQEILGRTGQLDEILVAASPDTDPRDLLQRITDEGPDGTEVLSSQVLADERADDGDQASSTVTLLLGAFSVVALFVGGFVILNTFTVVMAQRTRETGLLRAIGASRRQVTRSVLVEAVLVGGIASLLGTGIGIVMASGLRSFTNALDIELPDGGLVVNARTVVIPLVIGIALTLLASYIPARRAGRLMPIAALRDVDRRVTVGRGRVIVGIALAVVSPLLGVLGIPAAMAGVALLVPAVVPPAGRLVRPLLTRFGGTPGRLGSENATRNPLRTGATSSALMVGLALVIGMTVMADSMLSSFTSTLHRAVQADILVSSNDATGLNPGLADRISELPEVGSVARQRYGQFELVGIDTQATPEDAGAQELTAVDAATYADAFDLDLTQGAISDLADGGVIVLDDIAERQHWNVGDTIHMRFAKTGDETMRIAGIYADGTLEDQGYVIGLDQYEDRYTDQLDTRVFATAAPGTTVDELHAAVTTVADQQPGVQVDTAETYIDEVASVMDTLLGAVNVLLGLSVLIAVLGIVNTLALSIHERTRELGLARAVGMSKQQVRAMVRWEALIMSGLGSLSAVLVGAVVGRALLAQIGGRFGDEVTYPVGRLVLFVVLGLLLGLGAAALPARRAARTSILQAVKVS